ncbi:hypothetical protein ACP4OV_028824 [Aristida adscensionis]
MNVVGRVGSLISQGVYSVATPFHPFGGAVDIIAVEQPDGSYRSTPWYVRFGKFQGVLKGAEKVVTITVNGVDANFHMLLDNSGQAYFMRELVPGSEDSGTGSEEEAANESEPPARSKSDGDLYMGPSDRMGSSELNVEQQDKQNREDFESYAYGRLEESENSQKQTDGGNSEVVLVSVDGHVLTAPISSTEEGIDDVQLSDPQFHLGPGQSSSGDFSRSGEVWEAGILSDLYISQEKVKFGSGQHQSEVSGEHGEVPIDKDGPHYIRVDEDGALNVSVTEHEVLHVSVNQDEAHAMSTNEDEAQDVPRPVNNDEGYQPLTIGDESRAASAETDVGYQPVTSADESPCALGDNDAGYQPLTSEDESRGASGDINVCQPVTSADESASVLADNDAGYEPLAVEHEAHDVSENHDDDCRTLTNKDDDNQHFTNKVESCDAPVLENSTDCKSPASKDEVCDLRNEDIDVPLLEKAKDCRSPTNKDEACDLSNEDVESEGTGASFSKFDTFKSCLDLTSQADDGDSGNELFSPESDRRRGSMLSLDNHSVAETDLEEDESRTACCDQDDPLQEGVDNRSQSDDSSFEGGSHNRSKGIASAEIEKDKLGSIPEHSEEEELNGGEKSHKGLGVEISLCGNMLRPGMGKESAEEVFQQHLVHEEDFKSSGPSIMKNVNLIVKIDNKYFSWSKVSHVVLGKAVFGANFCMDSVDAIPVEHQETPREDSLGMSPSSRRWRLWPIPFRISRSLQRSNSDSSEDIFLDTETVLSPMDEQAPENNKTQSPRKQFVRTLIPTSEQVASLNLKEGQNMVTFSFSTRVLGKQQVDAHIYLWKWNAKIVISDVDGTITRSDVLGQVMPLVGRDWSQSGVARLFSAIKENGYQLLFLSARAIVQAYLTKNFLFNLKQDGKALPNGPVVISPDGLFPSLYREVIRRAPHEFKIACLEDIKALFPSDYNPFYAGFGNRDTDELSYKKMGIPKGKIFIINPKGEVAVNSSVDVKSYTSLHTLVNDMFPPTTLVEQATDEESVPTNSSIATHR